MSNWFEGLFTVPEIKSEFRRLAKQWHPDTGHGDTKIMADINAAYHAALKMADGFTEKGTDGRDHTYKYDREREQEIMDKIGELLALRLTGIEIDLIGVWIWVTGETKPVKDALNGAGLKWHGKRSAWYWQNQGYKARYARGASLGDLAAKYGSTAFKSDSESNLAA